MEVQGAASTRNTKDQRLQIQGSVGLDPDLLLSRSMLTQDNISLHVAWEIRGYPESGTPNIGSNPLLLLQQEFCCP